MSSLIRKLIGNVRQRQAAQPQQSLLVQAAEEADLGRSYRNYNSSLGNIGLPSRNYGDLEIQPFRPARKPATTSTTMATPAATPTSVAAEGTTYFDRAATRLNTELKIEMGDTGPDAGSLKKFLEGSNDALDGVDNAVTSRLKGVRTQLTGERGIGSGTMYSEDAIGAMFRNSEAGNINLGLSAASETASDNLLFKRLGNPDNFISSSLIGAGLGGGTAGLFGGDAGEGAMIGAMVGAGGSIATRAFRDALPELEENVFKKALANTEGVGNLRSQKLKAISAENFQAPEGLGKMDEFLLNRMKSTEKASIGMQSRFATASGAMLAGAAFSSARTKNKRRGFNQHRGNRF